LEKVVADLCMGLWMCRGVHFHVLEFDFVGWHLFGNWDIVGNTGMDTGSHIGMDVGTGYKKDTEIGLVGVVDFLVIGGPIEFVLIQFVVGNVCFVVHSYNSPQHMLGDLAGTNMPTLWTAMILDRDIISAYILPLFLRTGE
jgi:hypothetical protein